MKLPARKFLLRLIISSLSASLLLRLRPHGRLARTATTGTVICTAVAAELIANYVLVPGFDPGNGYDKALAVILILDVLGTIVILLLRRFGPPRAVPPGTPARNPSASPPDARLPSVR